MWVPGLNKSYAPTHGIFPSFLQMDKTAGAYSLQYSNSLTKEHPSSLVRHSTKGPPTSNHPKFGSCSGTILLTPYSMVLDWRVSRAFFQSIFIGLSCSIPTIVFYSFSLSLLSVNRLVLWGWGLRTDRVYITLSQPCTADL